MERSARPHARATYQAYKTLRRLLNGQKILLNGEDLDIATVVAVAKYGCTPYLDLNEDIVQGMNASVELLDRYLRSGFHVYGVNIGYGGSSDSRTDNFAALQMVLMPHTQSAVTTSLDGGENFSFALQDIGSHAMPDSWVKASMLVRENQILRGHSAVRVEVVQTVNELICKDLIPLVPLRGSISASGDLIPLSFIAGALQGCPDILIRTHQEQGYQLLPADRALQKAEIKPILLAPKEELGLINGTAPSAALASLALYETHLLTILSQYLTILASEVLGGNLEWLNPFIADTRPRIGQEEASANMRTFVAGSRLVTGIHVEKDSFKTGLCQDRYATRTSQQWIGPQLEDLMLAHQQVTIELNSISDNPLVDVSSLRIHSGENFQAASITSAMEKARLSLQMLGKMLFGQCAEMINPAMDNGLPKNHAADDPSLSFTMKGIDVNMASYMSELAFIASPVSYHVQSAEHHNQAINSLAFISARYTMKAVDLLSLISASLIYVGCQGLDLRVMHETFLESLQPIVKTITNEIMVSFHPLPNIDDLHSKLFKNITSVWIEANSLDTKERCEKVASTSVSILVSSLCIQQGWKNRILIEEIEAWRIRVLAAIEVAYVNFRTQFFQNQTTVEYLGQASKKIYSFVRQDLEVPFHRGLVEHPTPDDVVLNSRPKTIGSSIRIIYESLRDGGFYEKLMDSLAEGLVEIKTEDFTSDDWRNAVANGTNSHA